MSDQETIRRTWSNYWKSHGEDVGAWDTLSEIVLHAVVAECGGIQGKKILEAGCGTGRISLRMALGGAEVSCLDITDEALDLVRRTFGDLAPVHVIRGSILAMPREREYDVVWNAGVLEHFLSGDQTKAIQELLAVLNPTGRLVVLTPYAHSLPYRAGKWALERSGRWPYGREVPVKTLRAVVPPEGHLLREYTVSSLPYILDGYKFQPRLKHLCRALTRITLTLLRPKGFVILDRVLSKLFGGYLLVSVFERATGCDRGAVATELTTNLH